MLRAVLLKQRHLLLQVIDLLPQAFDLSGQQVERSGWRPFQVPLVPDCAMPGRVSIAARRTLGSHVKSTAKFGALCDYCSVSDGVTRIRARLRPHARADVLPITSALDLTTRALGNNAGFFEREQF
jgi:hypothetical protein